MKLVIAGTGYVGLVAGACFAELGHEALCVDSDRERIRLLSSGKSPIYEKNLEELMRKNIKEKRLFFTSNYAESYKNAELVFLCVGTPESASGNADLSYISAAARQIAQNAENDCLVVIKSTVPVGTNERVEKLIKDSLVNDVKIEVASNPEFLSQGTAVHDMLNASRIIIGTKSESAEKKLREIYAPFALPIVSVSRNSAEMIKYACNNFLALKISYMNEIANLCELLNADIQEVSKGMSFDDRIGSRFLNAGIGFGGSCFEKDIKALNYLAMQNDYEMRTIKAAAAVNEAQKTKLFYKARKLLGSFDGLKIAVLGLTFKPETNDIRGSLAIDNIELLLSDGANIQAYDPCGTDAFKILYPEAKYSISYNNNIYKTLQNADAAFIFTEWPEIKAVKASEFLELMKNPFVFDGRNIYSTKKMMDAGIKYNSIGR